MNFTRRIIGLLAILSFVWPAAVQGQGGQREDTAPAVTIRRDRMIFPEPQRLELTGKVFSFSKPAIVIAPTMSRGGAVQMVADALAEQGFKDVPIKLLKERVWDYDALFYVEVKYPRSPLGQLMEQRGFKGDWAELGKQGYRIHVEPPRPKLLVGYEIFIAGMSEQGTIHAAQSLRQLLVHHNRRRAAGEPCQLPLLTLSDWPGYPLRGVAMKLDDPRELKSIFQRLLLLKLNCFLDLQTTEALDEVQQVRVRRAAALAAEYGLEYIAAVDGVQGDFSRAELFKRDARLKQIETLAHLGVKRIVVRENRLKPPPTIGLNATAPAGPSNQQLVFFEEAVTTLRAVDSRARLDFWPMTDFGVPGDANHPLNWHRRDDNTAAVNYFRHLLSGLPPRARLIWRGPAVTVTPTASLKQRRKTMAAFFTGARGRQVLYLDERAGWQAQGLKAFDPAGLTAGGVENVICNFADAATRRAMIAPTLYSAADYLWNPAAYRPSELYLQELVDALAGPAAPELERFAAKYVRRYSAPGASLDGEALLRDARRAPGLRAEAGKDLAALLENLPPKIRDVQLRRETTRALQALLRQIDTPALVAVTQTGSVAEKLDALQLLILTGDRSAAGKIAPLLNESVNQIVSLHVAGALLQLGRGDDPFDAIKEAINNPRDEIRQAAVAQLAHDPKNRLESQLRKWRSNRANSAAVRLAAAYALAAHDDWTMFRALLDTLSARDATVEEHALALDYLQRLSGVKAPVPFIHRGENAAAYRTYLEGKLRQLELERNR